jgi:cytochrome c oxidase assembly protein subunit 11
MSKNSKLLIVLAAFGVGMFAFGYANVPLFQMFCSAVGIQIQNPDNIEVGVVTGDGEVDTSRELKVLFSTTVNDQLPILFESSKSRVTINPGATDQVDYRFVNLSSDTLYFRPVHSAYPAEANKKYDMIKCFCFQDMILLPREEQVHPLIYSFHTDLKEEVKRVTMHYTLFKRDPSAADWGKKHVPTTGAQK